MKRLRVAVIGAVLTTSMVLGPAATAQLEPPETAPPTQFVPACKGANFGQWTKSRLSFPKGEEPGKISHGAAGHCLGLFPVG